MRDGITKVLIIKALVIGPPGVGKTCIRCLLLDLPPPPRRTSTPLATRATRAISFFRLKTNGSGVVTWTELDDDTSNTLLLDLPPRVVLLSHQPQQPSSSHLTHLPVLSATSTSLVSSYQKRVLRILTCIQSLNRLWWTSLSFRTQEPMVMLTSTGHYSKRHCPVRIASSPRRTEFKQ